MNKYALNLTSLKNSLISGSTRKWVVVGVLIGIIAGFGSLLLYYAINFFTSLFLVGIANFNGPLPAGEGGISNFVLKPYKAILIPVSTLLGGLISGFIVYKFAPEAEGHGTDAAIDAFHNKNGRIRRRIPAVKLVASAITIGSGGSAGREGPTAQIAAGFGSFVADLFHMNDHDRRIAMAAGIGSGIGSIFLAPLGGALLSTEILYRRDFEVQALIPSIIASTIGYLIFGYSFGYHFLFATDTATAIGFTHPISLAIYLFVGIVAGLGGVLYVKLFYGVQTLFKKMKPISKYFRPAIGALIVGIIGMFFPQVLGLGYGWVQLILFNNLTLLPLWLLVTLFFLKIIATSFTIGSGGSGGVFAPGIVTGAFLGATMGVLIHPYFPFINVIEVTIVTMISFFGGVSKAPISVIIMGTEMTNSFALFLPLMLATTVSYFVSGYKNSIYEAQVLDRSMSPAHKFEYERPIMDEISVFDAMRTDYQFVNPEMSLKEALDKIHESKTKGVVVEENAKLRGFLSLEDIKTGIDMSQAKVKDVMTFDATTISKDKNVHVALDLLTKEVRGKLVVVDEEGSDNILGTISFGDVAEAYNREIRRIKAKQIEEAPPF